MSEIYYICDQKRQCSTSPGCIKMEGNAHIQNVYLML